MAIWTSSYNVIDAIPETGAGDFAILGQALDKANAKDIKWGANDLQLLMPMVKPIYGENGKFEAVKDIQMYFQENTDYLDAESFKKTVDSWYFTRKSWALSTGSFDRETFRKMQEKYGTSSMSNPMIEDLMWNTATALAVYRNIYLPNVVFETILRVPTTGGNYYEKFGFLRNTPVDKSALKKPKTGATDGAKGSLVRNHYRTIGANSGLSKADMRFYKDYLGEYNLVNKKNLIVMGDSSEIGQVTDIYSDQDPASWEITHNGVGTGVTGYRLDGMTLVQVDWVPEGFLFILHGDAETLVSRLQSENPEFRGVAIVTDDTQERFEDFRMMKNAKVEILEEGYHLTGRLQGMFVDLDVTRFSADRLMQSGGIDELNQCADDARGRWFRSVTESK